MVAPSPRTPQQTETAGSPSRRSRPLLVDLALRLVVPLILAMLALLLAGYLVHRQTILALLLDHDSEIATLAALDVEYEIREYARALQAMAANRDLIHPSTEKRLAALRHTLENQEQLYYDSLTLLDERRLLVASVPEGAAHDTAMADWFQGAAPSSWASANVLLGDVLPDPQTGEGLMVFGAPILGEDGAFAGALLGSFHTRDSELAEMVGDVNPGVSGYAYLVDRRGRAIFHPDASLIGADFSDRPFVRHVAQGETGGLRWDSPSGVRWIADYAPVGQTGWGVVVKELWDVAAAPAQTYGGLLIIVGAAVATAAAGLLWQAVRRVVTPVAGLADQTTRLANGAPIESTAVSGIAEIDRLGKAFDQMAAQIQAYRSRLRRFVEALTHSQEEERRRIARELHDETVQSLSAIARRLEVYQASAADPAYHTQLADIRAQITQALAGVRRISQDLRPPMLDDLGLLPALEALLQSARRGPDGIPQASLEVAGEPYALSRAQELAVYRIVQEAVLNVRRHARADAVQVRLAFEPQRIQLTIRDTGRGFVMPASLAEFVDKGHLGLMGIQERVWANGGDLALETAPGRGTQLHMVLPPVRAAPRPEQDEG